MEKQIFLLNFICPKKGLDTSLIVFNPSLIEVCLNLQQVLLFQLSFLHSCHFSFESLKIQDAVI